MNTDFGATCFLGAEKPIGNLDSLVGLGRQIGIQVLYRQASGESFCFGLGCCRDVSQD